MIPFGLSTGTLHRFDISLENKLKILSKYGATAVELVLILPEVATSFEITKDLYSEFEKFEHVSIHAPFIMPSANESKSPYQRMTYSDDDISKKIFEKLENLSKVLNVEAIVFHPETIKDKSILSAFNLKVAMENMDQNKLEGIDPEYFSEMNKKFNFQYVLDLHHVYTHDKTMKITDEYIEVMGDRLQYLHVSGQTNNEGHLPINVSENKSLIMSFAKKVNKPIILEGTISGTDIEYEVKKELDYIRKEFQIE